MTMTIQQGKSYPIIDGPMLKTQPNIKGIRHHFTPTNFRFVNDRTVEVLGVDRLNIWCTVRFTKKSAPKWLKQAIKAHRD